MSAALFRFENTETDDDGGLQTLKGTGYAGEDFVGVHRVMPFGISSHAPAGSHAIAIAGGGERELVAALGLEHPDYRPTKQKAGDTTIYDQSGNVSRYLGKDGIWHDAGDRPQKMTGKTLNHVSKEKANFGSSDDITYIGGTGEDGVYDWAMTASGPSQRVKIRKS